MKEKDNKENKMKVHYLLGCRFDNWLHLLWQNKFRITWEKMPQAFAITASSLIMWPFALLEELIFSWKIQHTQVEKSPVFILGHWRSGTTYLFNLMACDPQFAYFDAITTFTFNNFLLLRPLLKKFQSVLLPEKRPMDNIQWTLQSPQEEVFAVANRIPNSVAHMSSFLHNAILYKDAAFVDEIPAHQRNKWRNTYNYVFKKITYANKGKRMLLKSPDNTCKAGILSEMYPNAKFIHIYRNPYNVVMSTYKMFKELFPWFALQDFPDDEYVEDFILDLYKELYTKYFIDVKRIPKENIIEIRYEDFIKSPLKTAKNIYDKLDIPGFGAAKPLFSAYIAKQKHYKTNSFTLDDKLRVKINDKLGFFFDHYSIPMI